MTTARSTRSVERPMERTQKPDARRDDRTVVARSIIIDTDNEDDRALTDTIATTAEIRQQRQRA